MEIKKQVGPAIGQSHKTAVNQVHYALKNPVFQVNRQLKTNPCLDLPRLLPKTKRHRSDNPASAHIPNHVNACSNPAGMQPRILHACDQYEATSHASHATSNPL